MTSLIAWIGVDSRQPSSVYLASDSRISWDGKTGPWDFARKLFASSRYPDVLGYCGNVLFTSQVLGQVMDMVDLGCLFSPHAAPEVRFQAIAETIEQVHSTYPREQQYPFSVIHCTRRGIAMSSSFETFELSWSPALGWQRGMLQIPSHSGLVATYGSGKRSILESVQRWQRSDAGRTSRSIFSAFCDSIASGADPASGGAPQLAGMYRIGPAMPFGVVWRTHRYLHGVSMNMSQWLAGVEWRNELFERCDWNTGETLAEAQRQPRPRIL
jgi:hypothetical protein